MVESTSANTSKSCGCVFSPNKWGIMGHRKSTVATTSSAIWHARNRRPTLIWCGQRHDSVWCVLDSAGVTKQTETGKTSPCVLLPRADRSPPSCVLVGLPVEITHNLWDGLDRLGEGDNPRGIFWCVSLTSTPLWNIQFNTSTTDVIAAVFYKAQYTLRGLSSSKEIKTLLWLNLN